MLNEEICNLAPKKKKSNDCLIHIFTSLVHTLVCLIIVFSPYFLFSKTIFYF